jgi:hypothetical protein
LGRQVVCSIGSQRRRLPHSLIATQVCFRNQRLQGYQFVSTKLLGVMAGQDNLELPIKKMRLNQTYHQINIGID